MTIDELHIQLDIHSDNKIDILEKYSLKCHEEYFFVDSSTGDCHLFDKDGNKDNIKKIKKIYDYLFEYNKNLKKIKIPNLVTSIGNSAFYNCINLTSVTIPDSVKSIRDFAFWCCSNLTNITIPDSVRSIGSGAFGGCSSLMSVMINTDIIDIGFNIFAYCDNLKEVIFKNKTINKVKSMKNYPFGIKDKSIIKCI